MRKPIKGYEGIYEISDSGTIFSLERIMNDGKRLREKTMIGGIYPNEYRFICLRKNGENKNYLIHRLVAKTFIPNPNNYPVVNHLDGNKQNNNINNLEWCEQSDNLKHALKIGLIENQCKIRRKVTIKQGEHIILFDTMKDCAEFFGYKKGWLQNQIRKHGCIFTYKNYEVEVHERG